MAKVTLLTHTPDPERYIAAAAKLCYSASGVDTLLDKLTDEKAAEFVEMLASMGHESPIEHVSFTFGIEGVSRSLLAQITRHRIASFSVQSQRYVREKQFSFVTPPEIEKDPETLAIYNQAMQNAIESYDALADRLKERHMAQLMAEGMEEKDARRQAEKMAIEDARFVLPNAAAQDGGSVRQKRKKAAYWRSVWRHWCWPVSDTESTPGPITAAPCRAVPR